MAADEAAHLRTAWGDAADPLARFGNRAYEEHMSPAKEPLELPARAGTNTSEKVVVTFRFPRDLASWLGREAEKRGWSMNEFMVTVAHDLFGWYALPDIVVEQLEADAEAMGLDRRKYITRVLMRRYHEVLEKGPGFEKAASPAGGKRAK
jgi:hypothetical protein